MRIAIFSESYRPVINGVTTSVDVFARELRKLGHEVIIHAPDYPGYVETDPCVVRMPSYITPVKPDYPLAYPVIPGFRRRFKAMKFDLVHTQSPFALGRVGMRLARQHNLPLVTTNHTLYTEYAHYIPLVPQSIVRWQIGRMMQGYCNGCDYVVTPSESVRKLLESFGVRAPIRAVPTGPDAEGQVSPDPEFPRKHYNIPAESPLLLYAGRIAREKNMEVLVEAFGLIRKEAPEARLLIAGSGPHEDATKRYAADLGLMESVTFAGFLTREQVSQCYADSTAFLFASITDAQGLVITEAMMQGLPSVAVGAFGPTEWIEDGINGFLCENNPQSMADAALQIIRNPELRSQMGDAARQQAQSRSAPRCAEMMLEVYALAAERNKGRAKG